jgi:hypothetical protein
MASPLGTVLRPYLRAQVNPLHHGAYLRFYTTTCRRHTPLEPGTDSLWSSGTYKRRLGELRTLHPMGEDRSTFPSAMYPRMPDLPPSTLSLSAFRAKWDHLSVGLHMAPHTFLTTIYGMPYAI